MGTRPTNPGPQPATNGDDTRGWVSTRHPLSLSPYLFLATLAPASAVVASQGAIFSLPLFPERNVSIVTASRKIRPRENRLADGRRNQGCRSGLAMCPKRLRSRRPVPSKGEKRAEGIGQGGNPPPSGVSSCMGCAVQSGHVLESDLSGTFSWPARQVAMSCLELSPLNQGSTGARCWAISLLC